MRGFIDMWTMLGLIFMILAFVLLLFIQQSGQRAIEPSIVAPAVSIFVRRRR